ncbi:DUF1793-domain-containing protein [Dendrothele bispora CBS 962.96]|uniref:DUF1793-domain-containing protein n=1 Tax=Dendrothele bispora (strain CBS 962.96) TaxID=1314807 RepID=A0A4S8MYP7_DENBC|nr:DUF1793-domain-containing protein [Dendrothele bispora CBS 962.96]
MLAAASFVVSLIVSSVIVPTVRGLNWTATPFNPPSVPLAVRTPYLSAWLNQGEGTALNGDWATFWNGQIVGWAGFVKVDGKAYSFLGNAGVPNATFDKAVQKSSTFTSTQSVFVLNAGPVDVTVTFLSPVEPDDLPKQSFPFAYMAVSFYSIDGGSHSVQVYSDISGEWVLGDLTRTIEWSTQIQDALTHQVQLQNQTNFQEGGADRIQQGSAYYSTLNQSSGLTYQTGPDVDLRALFINQGKLNNTQDSNFRAISDNFPVFAYAHDVGTVNTFTTDPVVYSVGFVRDPAVEYIVANGQFQDRSLYFWSQFTEVQDAITSFLNDYKDALSRANEIDTKVETDASAVSEDYAGIVALSVRQMLGSIEITLSKKSDGSFNTDDVLVFMKEISSSGNVNTVDVIYPAWPALLYLNPTLGKDLLEPLFQYQATGQYPNKYAAHDIGSSYPQAHGHNDGNDEPMPVEESGNMLIMALSYAQETGDNSQIQKYESLLDQWTQFLITDSLIPANQISTDDFAGPLENQTNLAIKGIIGIKAMAQIASLLGDSSKSSNYSSVASSYVSQWQDLAVSADGRHLVLAYGDSSSWDLSYNLYADKLLKLNLFSDSVYSMQTAWYKSVANTFGVPLDTRHTYTKSDWEIWTAAFVDDRSVRDMLIGSVKKFASNGTSKQPLGDWYETTNGTAEGFKARPVVGGHRTLPLQRLELTLAVAILRRHRARLLRLRCYSSYSCLSSLLTLWPGRTCSFM